MNKALRIFTVLWTSSTGFQTCWILQLRKEKPLGWILCEILWLLRRHFLFSTLSCPPGFGSWVFTSCFTESLILVSCLLENVFTTSIQTSNPSGPSLLPWPWLLFPLPSFYFFPQPPFDLQTSTTPHLKATLWSHRTFSARGTWHASSGLCALFCGFPSV